MRFLGMFLVGVGLLGGVIVAFAVMGSAAAARSTPLVEPTALTLGREATVSFRPVARVAIEVSIDVRFAQDLDLEPGFAPMPGCRFPVSLVVTDARGRTLSSARATLTPGSSHVNAFQPADTRDRNLLRIAWLGDPLLVAPDAHDAPLVAHVRVMDGATGGGRVERVMFRASEPPSPHGAALAWTCLPCTFVPVGLALFGVGMRRARARGRVRELEPSAPEAA